MKTLLTTLLLVEVCLFGTCDVSVAEGLFETQDVFVGGQDNIREYRRVPWSHADRRVTMLSDQFRPTCSPRFAVRAWHPTPVQGDGSAGGLPLSSPVLEPRRHAGHQKNILKECH